MTNSFITDKKEFYDSMMTEVLRYNYEYIHKSKEECEIDKLLGKQIMSHLKYFFNSTNNKKTMKKMKTMINRNSNKPNKNKTRKIH